ADHAGNGARGDDHHRGLHLRGAGRARGRGETRRDPAEGARTRPALPSLRPAVKCPYCGEIEDKVIDSRMAQDGEAIRRRRECLRCSRRFTTYERIGESLPLVIKKDGTREPYDRQKVVAGLRRACVKRPIDAKRIEGIADEVERVLQERGETEVPSTLIGEIVLEKLRSLDDVAYVRFASVYRHFGSIDQFLEELSRLQAKKK